MDNLSREETHELENLLLGISKNFTQLLRYSKSFLEDYPLWEQASEEANKLYTHILGPINTSSESIFPAKYYNISVSQQKDINSYAILILFGMTHYLEWADFDIQNPVNFSEVAFKLPFVRLGIMNICLQIVQTKRIYLGGRNKSITKFCFGLGASLGNLLNIAYEGTPIDAQMIINQS
jgi:hypothetical protein